MRRASWPGALLLAGLAGCGSTDGTSEPEAPDKVTVSLHGPPEQTLELEDFEFDWEDLPVDDRGNKSAYELAVWVTERENAARRCLRADPPATTQAIRLLEEVLRRVPDSSKVRLLLAQTRFRLASYWWQATNAIHYDMAWVDYKNELPPAKGSRKLTDEEVVEFIASSTPEFERSLQQQRKHAQAALEHYLIYRSQRPDDKRVIDALWKLYYYVQDYARSLQALDYMLAEMEASEVPEEEPIRREYEAIREGIVRYLAKRRLAGRQTPAEPTRAERVDPVFPWSPEDDAAGRARRRRLGSVDSER